MSTVNPEISIELTKVFTYPIIVPTEKWVRARIQGTDIADSTAPLLLLDNEGRQTVYFFPKESVKTNYLVESDYKGKNDMFTYWHIKIGDKIIDNGAYTFSSSVEGEYKKLVEYIGFKWNAIDTWLEEEEKLIGHPRNPYHRLDARQTSRKVQFKYEEIMLAESTKAIALFETGIRTRYYVPKEDVKMSLFKKTDTTSICPYKGIATYWSLETENKSIKDIAWTYLNPFPDVIAIKDYVSFWKADLYVNDKYKGNY